uniref:ShKT domain-containing protein n=1 Tax=Strongyloides stercoralis TaxID=6248 RepID=A0A0K0ENT2_STRER
MKFFYILFFNTFQLIFNANLFDECSFTADCKVGFKPACLNIGSKNYCIEQCDEGEDLYQCGRGKKCRSILDIDGTRINSCAYEVNCLKINQCTKAGEICSPYSLTCLPVVAPFTTTTRNSLTTKKILKPCIDKGFLNETYTCSTISELCNQPKYKEFMEEYCSKTCGFCKNDEVNCNTTSCKNTFKVKLTKEITAFIQLPQNFKK